MAASDTQSVRLSTSTKGEERSEAMAPSDDGSELNAQPPSTVAPLPAANASAIPGAVTGSSENVEKAGRAVEKPAVELTTVQFVSVSRQEFAD
jgi:hypothetical protein